MSKYAEDYDRIETQYGSIAFQIRKIIDKDEAKREMAKLLRDKGAGYYKINYEAAADKIIEAVHADKHKEWEDKNGVVPVSFEGFKLNDSADIWAYNELKDIKKNMRLDKKGTTKLSTYKAWKELESKEREKIARKALIPQDFIRRANVYAELDKVGLKPSKAMAEAFTDVEDVREFARRKKADEQRSVTSKILSRYKRRNP